MDAAAIRREEILAKKNKLEELRRARAARDQELRKSKQDATTGTGTIGTSNPIATNELDIDTGKFFTMRCDGIARNLSTLHPEVARPD